MSTSRWTDTAYARLEEIVREQDTARARLRAIGREWPAQRIELMETLATLSAEYDELYLALDTYAAIEAQPIDRRAYAAPGDAPFSWAPQPFAPLLAGAGLDLDTTRPASPRGLARSIAALAAVVIALGLAGLVAVVASGRLQPELAVALPPATAAAAGVAATSEPAPVALAPQAARAPAPVAASSAAKRDHEPRRAKSSRKRARSHTRPAKPGRRIVVSASADPLAGV